MTSGYTGSVFLYVYLKDLIFEQNELALIKNLSSSEHFIGASATRRACVNVYMHTNLLFIIGLYNDNDNFHNM